MLYTYIINGHAGAPKQRQNYTLSHVARVRKGQPGKVANLARGQLSKENKYFPVSVRA